MPTEVARRRGRRPGVDSGGRPLPVPAVTFPQTATTVAVPESLQEAGKKLWQQTAEAGAVWLAPTDLGALEQVCLLADDLAIARAKFRKLHDASSGRLIAVLTEQILKGLSALGLDPTSRARLGVAEVVAQTKADDLLERRLKRNGAS